MKKALLLCCCLLWAAQLLALPANVLFVSERGAPFRLIFDGRSLTRGVSREVYLHRVVPGVHWAEFRIPAQRGFVNYRTRVVLDGGYETRYELVTRRGYAPVLRKISMVRVRPSGHYPARPDNGGYYQDYPRRDDRDYDNYDDDRSYPTPYDDQYDRRDDDRYDNRYPYDRESDDREPAYENRQPGYGRYATHLSSYEVDNLLAAVEAKAFDSDKLDLVKSALAQSSIATPELKRVLAKFSFEDKRLELAKYAYPHVSDPQNFYQVESSFTFDSNARALRAYVAEAGKTTNSDSARPARKALSASEVETLLRTVQRQPQEDDKLQTLQTALASASLRTTDLQQLMRAFNQESKRLALAKYAYPRVADPQNFQQVYTMFNLGASVRELQDYVRQQPGN